MKIHVDMYGTLLKSTTESLGRKGIDMDIPAGSSVKDLLLLLGLGDTKGTSVIIDGVVCGDDSVLKHGTSVSIIPSLSGG